MELEQKITVLDLKADADKREISGYAATFGGLDSYDDTIVKGAFAATLAAKFKPAEDHVKIRTLWNHNWDVPIGKPTALNEDDKGLAFVATLARTKAADDVLEMIREKVVEEMSIGYLTKKASYREDDRAEWGYVRILEEIDLWEISPVTFGADSNTSVAAKVARVAELKRHGYQIKARALQALQAEIKAGRVLSAKNLDKLKAAVEAIQDVINAASVDDVADDGEKDNGAALELALKTLNEDITALVRR